ncbi:MAG TPA: hypothetical protein VKE22_16995 [Haliangiales bacterium]|nr:hypothetical protein [Haliangiales bacterium]
MRLALLGFLVIEVGAGVACGGAKKDVETPRTVTGGGATEDLRVPAVDTGACDEAGKKVAVFDLNQDGKPDVWKYIAEKDEKGTKVEAMVCKKVDLNHDGKVDYIVQYDDAGNIKYEEYDFDFDGKFDARFHYDPKTKRKTVVERVSGFTGKVDIWEKYGPDDKLESVRRDRNGDGKPDYWENYVGGVLVQILYDDDFDGRVDRKDELKAGVPVGTPGAESPPSEAPTEEAKPTPAEEKPAEKTAPAKPAPKKKPK